MNTLCCGSILACPQHLEAIPKRHCGYTNSLTITPLAVQEGAYYLLLSVDDEWQVLERHQLNNEFAVATDLVIPRLTNAVPFAGTLIGNGDEQYFRIDVPAGQNLFIRLDGLENQGASEVYVRLGGLPTRGTFDHRAAMPGSVDQQVLIPGAAPGIYYVMVRGESVAGSGQFTLEATAASIQVTGVIPNRYGQHADAVVTVDGAGFDASAKVELVAGGGTAFGADEVSADTFTRLTAAFNLSSVPSGTYSIRVSSPTWGTNQLANAFEVVGGVAEPNLETELTVPAQVGYHTVATIWVEYRNTGTAAMPAPLLVLTATQNGKEGAWLTLEDHRLVEGFWTSAQPEGFSHSIQILASGDTPGVLQPGDSVQVPVYYAGWQQPWDRSYPPIYFNLGVLLAEDTTTVDWPALKASMKPTTINGEAWEVLWAGFTSQVGATWGDYVRMLDDNATYLGRLGQRVVDVGQLLAFEFLQADGLSPLRTLASAVEAAVEAPGLPLVFSRSFSASIASRFESGPLSRGWSHNWQYSLAVASDGTVTVTGPGGSRRVFQPDSRSTGTTRYFTQPGDQATLTAIGGGLFSLREPAGLARAFRADGKLDYVQDPNGNRITCGYSGALLTSLVHSAGQRLTIGYAGSRIQSITDHLGRQTVYDYDSAFEHLLSAQYYDGRTASYAYAGAPASSRHALTEVANSCCTRRYFAYDAQGRISGTYRDGNAEAITFTYDNAGKVTATDALEGASKFHFDQRGLLVKTEDALGNAVHMAFDDNYNPVRLTDPAGRAYGYTYDGNGNLTRSTDPLGHASRFTYHPAFNRLATVTDAKGNLTRYAYTYAGNLQSITYADGSREGWAYDTLGNATTWTNRRASEISYTYDAAGRLTAKTFMNPRPDCASMSYAYDHRGNLTNAATHPVQLPSLDPPLPPTTSAAMSYDAGDRLTNIVFDGGKWLAFTYDSAGRRASSLDQLGHRLAYAYDAAGRLESMTNELGQLLVDYEYDPAGRLARKTLGNGMVATYGYDAAGQLLALTNRLADGAVISWFNYVYDSRGRRTGMSTHYGVWAYEYDDLGQLTRAVLNSTDPQIHSQDLAYVYDALGNRVRTIENGVTTEYTANNLNQYVHRSEVGGQRKDCVFDLDGNLIAEIITNGGQRTTNTFVYSDENRLIAVTQDASLWDYLYDALGNRVATSENGVVKRFVIDPTGLGNVVGEYDGNGNLLARYDHGLGLLSQTEVGGNPAYYAFDAIGNTHQLVTSAGAIANAYAYAPFGGFLRRTETIPNPFEFVGEFGVRENSPGVNYMRARFYAADSGVFTSEDPISTPGASCREYVRNDPCSLVDPSGLYSFPKFLRDLMNKIALGGVPDIPCFAHAATTQMTLGNALAGDVAGGLNRVVGLGLTAATTVATLVEMHAVNLQDLVNAAHVRTTMRRHNNRIQAVIDAGQDYGASGPQGSCADGTDFDTPAKNHAPRSVPVPPTMAGGSGNSGTSGSRDPNQKTGPAGFGTNSYITASGTLAYRVDFENETNASAPAQQVVITDQLNGHLDWSTFRLAEVGFGDKLIIVPPNSQHFETNVPVSYLGTDFEVQIEVGIQIYSGLIYANLRSIDPATSLPPPVNIGFLPPEDGTGRGMGHVSYTIKAKPSLPTGTQIRNVALISFDLLPGIATNQRDPHNPGAGTDPAKECLNTIDADTPSSAVNALPAEGEAEFILTWSGTDSGAGVTSYDIYVSTNGAPWGLWLAGTTANSATFEGRIGQTYGFASIARDGAGNTETLPPVSTPDAQTKVVRDSRVPPLYVHMFAEGFLGVYWQVPAHMAVGAFALENSATLGQAAVWTPQDPDLIMAEQVVWVFVDPAEQSRFYRLKSAQ